MERSRAELATKVESRITVLPDFPTPGVLFRDMTSLVADGPVFSELIKSIASWYKGKVDALIGLESRGFVLASPIAVELGLPMVMVRKAGKLPPPVIGVDYSLEYGKSRIELIQRTVTPGSRVLIVDDVLATGGTAAACVHLLEQCGAKVEGLYVLMELLALNGRKPLGDLPVESLLQY